MAVTGFSSWSRTRFERAARPSATPRTKAAGWIITVPGV
jgi:hypothetical protein